MDYSVDVENLKRPEVLAQLKQYNISLSGHSTKQLKNTLQNQMPKENPSNSFIFDIIVKSGHKSYCKSPQDKC